MAIQIRIPPALAAIHNMLVELDPYDLEEHLEDLDAHGGPPDRERGYADEDVGELAMGPIRRAEERRANARRDRIAQEMWTDYQRIVREREGGL